MIDSISTAVPMTPAPGIGAEAPGSGLVASDGSSGGGFGEMFNHMLVQRPSDAVAKADSLATQYITKPGSVDHGVLAIETAKAGIEVHMATETMSQIFRGVRTILQTQI